MQGGNIVLFFKRGGGGLTRIAARSLHGVGGKLFMPLCQTSDVKNFPLLLSSVTQKSQQDVLTPKLLGIMRADRPAPERLDVELKVPYASHLQICIFHSRLNRSSLMRLIIQKLYKSLENCII